MAWSLEPDLVTLGKFIGGGVPIGVYGMSAELSDVFESPDPDDSYQDIASGGPSSPTPSMTAARATLSKVMTSAATRTRELGACCADGIERISRRAGFSWSAHRLYARSGYTYAERLPRNAAEYYEHEDVELDLLKRVYFANRGVWEALIGAGPTASVAATREDVDHYLAVLEEFVGELVEETNARIKHFRSPEAISGEGLLLRTLDMHRVLVQPKRKDESSERRLYPC